jgi:glycosyltransferase involved in cell wall biosynthesis
MEKIAVVIPCYNEAQGISNVIRSFPYAKMAKFGFKVQVFVIDNNSTDDTARVAKEAGAIVMHEPKKGKGNAVRSGFARLPQDIDYVAMLDGDDTYSAHELLRMIEPLHNGFCDAVIGSRLGGQIEGDSMTAFNRSGNWIFTHLVRYAYRTPVTDVLTGYFAWKKDAIDDLHPYLVSDGFAIEMEMITKMARMGIRITSVPISYAQRAGDSNLRPIHDGFRILRMFLNNLAWKPDMPANVETIPVERKTNKRQVTFAEQLEMGLAVGSKPEQPK